MAFAAALARAGHVADSINTQANVTLDKKEAGWTITHVELVTMAVVPGIDGVELPGNCPDIQEELPGFSGAGAVWRSH